MVLSLFKPNVSKRAAKGDIAGLIRALHYKRDQRVRATAARALGLTIAPRAVPALIKALSVACTFSFGAGAAIKMIISISISIELQITCTIPLCVFCEAPF
jgi:hypothetical protein